MPGPPSKVTTMPPRECLSEEPVERGCCNNVGRARAHDLVRFGVRQRQYACRPRLAYFETMRPGLPSVLP